MVIIGGTVEYETDDNEALFDLLRKMMADSQAEEGCIAFEFSPDLNKPNLLHLYEIWENKAALDAHSQSAHMAKFKEEAFPFFTGTAITRYYAEVATD